MTTYRYILEPYKGMSSRYTCPGPDCNKRKVFVRYIDNNTGEHLPEQYGKCNRLDKCGYHLSPYHDGHSQMIYEKERGEYKENWEPTKSHIKTPPPTNPISFIPSDLFKKSLQSYEENNFVKFLVQLFGNDIATGLISKYFIGTSKHWPGANIFWQIDIEGMIRSGKIMLYNPITGKRKKYFTWVHSVIKLPGFELRQVFYGEHLLKNKIDPVAIVESEKTAIIASVYFPQFIWIAASGVDGLSAEKCQVLKDRQVILYPDLSRPKPGNPTAFEKWVSKVQELNTIANFTVNDLLERKASEAQRIEGCDLADFLINFDYKEFLPKKAEVIKEVVLKQPVIYKSDPLPVQHKKNRLHETDKKIPVTWRHEVTELEKYFSLITIPAVPFKLNSCSTIENFPLFIETHFETLKNQDGNKIFLPFLNRLRELKQVLNI